MKIKPLYIYLSLFVIAIAVIIIFDANRNNKGTETQNFHQNMPNDEVHKGMGASGEEAPSKSNVRESAMKRMVELKKAVEANPDDTAKVKEYAMMLAMGHQPQKAIELFDGILKKDPKRIDVLLTLSFLYYNQGNLDKAEDCTNKVLSIDKNQKEANFNLGVIAEMKHDKQKAEKIFNDVIKRFPNTDISKQAEEELNNLKNAKTSK